MSKWTRKDEQYLIDNKEKPLKEIAKILNRTVQAIKDKRRSLGLKRVQIKNLKGKRFGRLLVLKDNGRIGRRVAWLCRCDCGVEKNVSSTHLIQGDTKSCGCLSRDLSSERNSLNLAGKKFGNLTVIKETGRTNDQLVKWLCKCDCGKETIAIGKNIINGNTSSCGCRRDLNKRQGDQWEKLIKKFLKFKVPNFIYHERLPNSKIPDFTSADKKIILDAKRHDYLRIEECIDKYSPYCEKLIFICMIKKRFDWKKDFQFNEKIEFWYPGYDLTWIPKIFQNEFLGELKKIKNMSNKEQKPKILADINKAINRLVKKNKQVKQETIAKEMGTGRNIFREIPELVAVVNNFHNQIKVKEEKKFIIQLRNVIFEKNSKGERITFQGIAKSILGVISKKDTRQTGDQQLWTLTRKLSDNSRYSNVIKEEQEKITQLRLKIIKQAVISILNRKKNVTTFEIRELTGLPKNYLYSKELKVYINKIIDLNKNKSDFN